MIDQKPLWQGDLEQKLLPIPSTLADTSAAIDLLECSVLARIDL
jgi:hypothetical protein